MSSFISSFCFVGVCMFVLVCVACVVVFVLCAALLLRCFAVDFLVLLSAPAFCVAPRAFAAVLSFLFLLLACVRLPALAVV